MILKKLAGLGAVGAVATAGDCTVIPFPTAQAPAVPPAPEQPLWWVLVKLIMAIPGSLTALMMLTFYSSDKPWMP